MKVEGETGDVFDLVKGEGGKGGGGGDFKAIHPYQSLYVGLG